MNEHVIEVIENPHEAETFNFMGIEFGDIRSLPMMDHQAFMEREIRKAFLLRECKSRDNPMFRLTGEDK